VHKFLNNVSTLSSDLIHAFGLEISFAGVCGAFAQSGIHKCLTQILGHVGSQRELGGDHSGDYSSRVLWVALLVGLDELQPSQVFNSLLCCERVWIALEHALVRLNRE